MRASHIALGIIVAAVWGFNFIVIHWGLGSIPPLFLASIRFAVAALPAIFLPRPSISWGSFLAIGSTWFLGQFAFLFIGMSVGMPPGLASILMQTQAFLTVLLAALVLGEKIAARRYLSMTIAAVGLVTIGATIGGWAGDVTPLGFALTIAASTSWAVGNVLVRRQGASDMLSLVCWLCIVPPLPLFAASLVFEGWPAIERTVHEFSLGDAGVVLYLGLGSTIFAYGVFGHLMKVYSASAMAPFAFLVPCFGTLFAWTILGETFSLGRMIGVLLVLSALAVLLLPAAKMTWRSSRAFLRAK